MAIFGLLVVWAIPLGSIALNIWFFGERERMKRQIKQIESAKRDLEFALLNR